MLGRYGQARNYIVVLDKKPPPGINGELGLFWVHVCDLPTGGRYSHYFLDENKAEDFAEKELEKLSIGK